MATNLPAELESIPEVTLSDAQAARAYQLKRQWERPNGQLLIPVTLTRYIVHLQDEVRSLERSRDGWADVAATRNVNIALIAEERDRLRGELAAAEQHVKILQDQVASFAPAVETPGSMQYEQDYTVAELAAMCRTKDRHIARLESERDARRAGETRCSATWQPIIDGPVIPCTLPAGHAGKHRAPEPFAEEDSLLGVTRGQMDYTTAVVGNAFDSGMTKQQFLTMVNLAWDARQTVRTALKAEGKQE